jgi:hypothetical protein
VNLVRLPGLAILSFDIGISTDARQLFLDGLAAIRRLVVCAADVAVGAWLRSPDVVVRLVVQSRVGMLGSVLLHAQGPLPVSRDVGPDPLGHEEAGDGPGPEQDGESACCQDGGDQDEQGDTGPEKREDDGTAESEDGDGQGKGSEEEQRQEGEGQLRDDEALQRDSRCQLPLVCSAWDIGEGRPLTKRSGRAAAKSAVRSQACWRC